MATEMKLPPLGETTTSGTVVSVLVKEGEHIDLDKPLFEIEAGKSVVEVPATVTGVVKKILVKTGDEVNVGQGILAVETMDGDGAATASAEKAGAPDAAAERQASTSRAAAETPSPNGAAVGDGAQANGAAAAPAVDAERIAREVSQTEREGETTAQAAMTGPPRHDRTPPPSSGTLPAGAASSPVPGPAYSENGGPSVSTAARAQQAPPINRTSAPASPSVRRLAREIGVDINLVKGSGAGGRISETDVKEQAKQLLTGAAPGSAGIPLAGVAHTAALPDFARWGEIERRPLSNVRRATAEQMTRSWLTVPHVTQFDKADITDLEKLRKRYGKMVEMRGGKLTVTSILLNIVATALRLFPQFNSSLDMNANELVLKKYCHIGVAVDTERGLIVPVVRDADRKSIIQLSVEMNELAQRARDRKTTLEEMQGGTFTVTNLGGIGGTTFTPIVNSPEVAILGVARAAVEPVLMDGQFQPRLILPLALSYDHRVIDGADGARFLRWIASALEEPFLLALEG